MGNENVEKREKGKREPGGVGIVGKEGTEEEKMGILVLYTCSPKGRSCLFVPTGF